jgi:hypothetical protein
MKNVCIVFLTIILYSCNGSKLDSPTSRFSTADKLVDVNYEFDEDDFSRIEGLQCNENSLVALDFHSGKSFTLFDTEAKRIKGRFGTIGQGPGELPLGCYGYLYNNSFYISYDPAGMVAKYMMDSLSLNIDEKPINLTTYEIPDAFFSRVIPVNDTLFLGAGTYQSKYQFVLFNSKNDILDYGIEIYNSDESSYNIYHKFLSNQGVLQKHPTKNKFVYSINYSSNIDFIEVRNNEIHSINSLRLRNPKNSPYSDGEINRILPDEKSPIGYIDIATDENYIYALYTDKKMVKENGMGNTFSSNYMLVFDWEGKPVKKLLFKDDVHYIAINEKKRKIYAAVIMNNKGWNVATYRFEDNL